VPKRKATIHTAQVNVRNVPRELWQRFVGMAKMDGLSAGEAVQALITRYCLEQKDKAEKGKA